MAKEYIERTELIENLNRFAPGHYNALINQIITNQPTVDVAEVKHGEWVKNDKTRTCSCCGYFYINVDMEDDNYCPNCGAKMDGGKTE